MKYIRLSLAHNGVKYVEQNIATSNIVHAEEDWNRLEALIPLGTETSYLEDRMKGVNL